MIKIRKANDIYQAKGQIENGFFRGMWHFSFDEYLDKDYTSFGTLRVFNDDTLSPGAVWPLHPHSNIEVVTYCAGGEFRHADEHGKGGILKKGWVQHTTVGTGMFHSEINNHPDEPMRFIQMWFIPEESKLIPSVEQKKVKINERTNKLLPLVSNEDKASLRIASDAKVYSSFLQNGRSVSYKFKKGYAGYLYVLEGGPISVKNKTLQALDAAIIEKEPEVLIKAGKEAELLLIVVPKSL